MSKINLSVDIAGIKMQNPVTTASGTFGFGLDYLDYFDVNQLGAVVTKTITINRRMGNPPPRIIETPSGLLNSIGLANPGIDEFIQSTLLDLEHIKAPIIVSIAGDTEEEYVELAERLDKVDKIAGIELNVSCPNVRMGGIQFGVCPEQVNRLTKASAAATQKPLIVKLTPNVTDIVEVACAAVEGGARSLSLINTLLGMSIDINKRKPVLANNVGGLAGPAIRPVAVRMVWQVAQAVDVPIIGVGGICDYRDALEFIMAGAASVGVGTWNFVNPTACVDIIEGLRCFCLEQGVKDINELVGCSWK
ncbi:MAG: dihydroorotate dehydrogenase [Clostridia bacterium]|nr:dihydroorotate dehydrogenase [Clostridia bacterium]